MLNKTTKLKIHSSQKPDSGISLKVTSHSHRKFFVENFLKQVLLHLLGYCFALCHWAIVHRLVQ